MVRVSSADVLELHDSRFADILAELNEKQSSTSMKAALGWVGAGLTFLAMLGGGVGGFFAGAIITVLFMMAGAWLDSFQRTSVLMYELEADARTAYEALVETFDRISGCAGKWHVDAGGAVRDLHTWKRNAGASHVVDKRPTVFSYSLPRVIRSNITPPAIQSGKETLYFLPDFLLVVEAKKLGAVAYDDLVIHWDDSAFIEEGTVPSDAQVISHTWKHPNKNGGPDRRFSNNYQIPVCLYENIHFTSTGGLNELLQVSRSGVTQPFAEAIQNLDAANNSPDKRNREPSAQKLAGPSSKEPAKPSEKHASGPQSNNLRIGRTPTRKETEMPSSPFGIEIGSPLSGLSILEELGQGKYMVQPPKPHPTFETFLVQASDNYGVVWIKGIGPEIPNDSYGNSVKAVVDKLQAQLEGRYGPAAKTDVIFPDALFDEPRDWAMALIEKERLYFCHWEKPDAASMPDDLKVIYLGASAVDGSTTNVVLEYASHNLDAAEMEMDDANAELL